MCQRAGAAAWRVHSDLATQARRRAAPAVSRFAAARQPQRCWCDVCGRHHRRAHSPKHDQAADPERAAGQCRRPGPRAVGRAHNRRAGGLQHQGRSWRDAARRSAARRPRQCREPRAAPSLQRRGCQPPRRPGGHAAARSRAVPVLAPAGAGSRAGRRPHHGGSWPAPSRRVPCPRRDEGAVHRRRPGPQHPREAPGAQGAAEPGRRRAGPPPDPGRRGREARRGVPGAAGRRRCSDVPGRGRPVRFARDDCRQGAGHGPAARGREGGPPRGPRRARAAASLRRRRVGQPGGGEKPARGARRRERGGHRRPRPCTPEPGRPGEQHGRGRLPPRGVGGPQGAGHERAQRAAPLRAAAGLRVVRERCAPCGPAADAWRP
mmetsp:Transcript_33424/g.104171  ORF Transcript_33424/g.104171 Transcript_33424/m.104171 type:complete len:377 (+) Transcript_33424:3220-4350(+)